MVILCEKYIHKLFGFISSEEATICKTMSTSSPEPKGTLTPPGSSPLGSDCAQSMPNFTQSSAPPSPETPMTPDSAHMTVEPLVANQSVTLNLEGTAGELLNSEPTNQEPLIGAKKRKAAKVHKLEQECVSRATDAGSRSPSRLTCNVCQTVMTSQHEFTRHIRTHNRVIENDNSGTKLFECGLCQKQLSSNSSLDRHMLVHSGERPFRCHICGTHFTTNGNMHRHIRGHFRNGGAGSDTGDSDGGSEGGGSSSPRKRRIIDLDDDGPAGKIGRYQNDNYLADDEVSNPVEDLCCPVCGIEQNGASGLELHLEKQHPEHSLSLKSSESLRRRSCSSEKNEPSPTDLSTASLTILPTNAKGERLSEGFGGVHHCPTCSLPFPSVESWLLHLRDHPTLKCNHCSSSFDNISKYTEHQRCHSQDEGMDLRPEAPFSLFSHSRSSPSLFPRGLPFAMTNQPISFPNSDPLNRRPLPPTTSSPISFTRHPTIPSHSPLSLPTPPSSTLSHDEQFARDYKDMKLNGQYPCRLCKEVYANLRKLKSHNLVHMVAPPYQCNLCTFVSNDKNTLKEHMKNHKGDTPYECNLCSLSFTTKANCERHIKNIHGKQTRDEVKRCMMYTPQDEGPASHETSRETVCHLCKFDCKSRSVLRDHMRSSHPEGVDKPYLCKICRAPFQSSSDAYRHIIQAHQNVVSSESLETLVEQRPAARREDVQDLSSVESLLTFSKLPLSISSSKPLTSRPPSLSMSHPPIPTTGGALTIQKVPVSFPPPATIVSPSLPISAYTPPVVSCDDIPLDLSMNKRRDDDDDKNTTNYDEGSDDEEITVIDEEEKDQKPILRDSKHAIDSENNTTFSYPNVHDLKPGCGSPTDLSSSPDAKSAFPLMYPGQLPVQFLPFQGQYPFLMNPFGTLPPVANLQLLEQYQEIKRGLQLTSGGSMLSSDTNPSLIPSVCNSLLNPTNNHLLKTSTSSFQLSAMALAASHNEKQQQQKQHSDDNSTVEKRPQTMATDLSPSRRENDDISHFTMRNSVLVKKPKQRRYRTERPWRCDLCDKGFTLRSNMERHMKQQHPDLWQQRPRGVVPPPGQRIGSSPGNSREFTPTMTTPSATFSPQKLSEKNDIGDGSLEAVDVMKEDDESELIIDDEEDCDDVSEENTNEETKPKTAGEENAADLASVQKLISTASSQNFSFFHRDVDESDKNDENSSPCLSPLSQPDTSSEDGKKCSAYSSAPQKQKCPFCHRKFPWSSSLVRHIRTHTGQKPYLCPVCHFPFTTKSNCDRHLQRKHPDSHHALLGDRPYRCVKCPGAAFTSIESLRKHDMFKHERANDTMLNKEDFKTFASKVFSCYICDVRCCSSKEMLQHVAETHPENFRSLRLHDVSTTSSDSPTMDNNNETSPQDSVCETSLNGSDLAICMLCYIKVGSTADLREHITSHHIYSPSHSPFSPDCCHPTEEKREGEEEEEEEEVPLGEGEITSDKRGERETSEFISNMLGTKPAVIDHLLSSKSTVDAAKLLGV